MIKKMSNNKSLTKKFSISFYNIKIKNNKILFK